jgi:hypothetical protein
MEGSMSKFLIDEYPLIVLPTLAHAVGLNEAIFLQQLNYWLVGSSHNHDGRKWVYNTFEDWQKQMPFFKVITIKRIVKTLRESGVIVTTSKYNKLSMDRTLWYSIDHDKLDSIISAHPSDQNDTMPVDDPSPSYQNDPSIVSKRYDAEYQFDTTYNQRLPETTTDTSATQPVLIAPDTPTAAPEPPPRAKKHRESGRKEASPATQEILAGYAELKGIKISYGKEGVWAKNLAEAGGTRETVAGCYKWLKAQAYWQNIPVTLAIVYQNWPEYNAYVEKKGKPQPKPSVITIYNQYTGKHEERRLS